MHFYQYWPPRPVFADMHKEWWPLQVFINTAFDGSDYPLSHLNTNATGIYPYKMPALKPDKKYYGMKTPMIQVDCDVGNERNNRRFKWCIGEYWQFDISDIKLISYREMSSIYLTRSNGTLIGIYVRQLRT
jgi:hypothetical protein